MLGTEIDSSPIKIICTDPVICGISRLLSDIRMPCTETWRGGHHARLARLQMAQPDAGADERVRIQRSLH